MKRYMMSGCMTIIAALMISFNFSSCTKDDSLEEGLTSISLIYKPGTDVKLINKAEYCQSVIADGKELITGTERGAIRVSELKDPKVYITFKKDLSSLESTFEGCEDLTSIPSSLFSLHRNAANFAWVFSNCKSLQSLPKTLFSSNTKATDFSNAFLGCENLKEIPENLFAHNPNVTTFDGTFTYCTGLQSIPTSLFDNNKTVTSFTSTFDGCTSLTGESPYTIVNNTKVHLYEREYFPQSFSVPSSHYATFCGCTSLNDYTKIPDDWK